jgi:hypothetical protein
LRDLGNREERRKVNGEKGSGKRIRKEIGR